MNLKVLILIGILILTGIAIWFSIQTEKVTPPEISIESEKEERRKTRNNLNFGL